MALKRPGWVGRSLALEFTKSINRKLIGPDKDKHLLYAFLRQLQLLEHNVVNYIAIADRL